MAASEDSPPLLPMGEQLAPGRLPGPDPPHAPPDLDHDVVDSLSDELLRLVLKESEEAAARIQDDGVEGADNQNQGGSFHDDNATGWETEDERDGQVHDAGDDLTHGGTGMLSFPVRAGADDCTFYMKTGTCKFGSLCKFNHPVRRVANVEREWIRDKEEMLDKPGQIECKYYLRTGGCRYGKACRYSHPRMKHLVAPVTELNFLGLPIRPGEKECPYYMRNGSCKYAANCRFNHPDPTASGGGGGSRDLLGGYGNGLSASLKGPSQPISSWTAPSVTLNETAALVPAVYPTIGGVAPHKAEWNAYQVPLFSPERPVLAPHGYMGKNLGGSEATMYANNKKQMLIEEFPERPGQPDCAYFLKTGDCKFKSNCKYNHPKHRTPSSSPVPLSDKGLPLRPDQNICSYYSRYGICKFGPACRFNHPVNWTPSNLAAPFSSFSGPEGPPRMVGDE